MKQFLEVFKFEFFGFCKQKSFVITTAIFVVVIAAVLFFPRVSAMFEQFGGDEQTVGEQGAEDEQSSYLFVDAYSGDAQASLELFSAALPAINMELSTADKDSLSTMVNNGEYDGALYLEGPLSYSLILPTLEIFDSTTVMIDQLMLQQYRVDAFLQNGVSPNDTTEIMSAVVSSEVVALGNDQTQNFFYSYILIFVLYLLVITYGSVIAVSVATEKSSRAMEMLITSADTKNLMFGKILGTSAACIGQFCIVAFSAFIFYNLNAEYLDNPFITDVFAIPLDILIYALVFCVLGFLIYAMLFGALGSLVTKTEEVNSALTPVMLPFVGTFMLVMFTMTGVIGGGVDGVLMKVLSFIPLSAPFAMFVRISMGAVLPVEIAIGIAILVISVFLTGLLTAKIYRVGVLLYGTPLKLPALIKAIKNA